jgi:hypothetical protein
MPHGSVRLLILLSAILPTVPSSLRFSRRRRRRPHMSSRSIPTRALARQHLRGRAGKKSPWSFTLELYAWLPALTGDISVKGLPATHVDFSPKTLLSNLQWVCFDRRGPPRPLGHPYRRFLWTSICAGGRFMRHGRGWHLPETRRQVFIANHRPIR